MSEKNPLDILLAQIGEMLKLIDGHEGSIAANLSPEAFLELEKLEKTIDMFEELNSKSLREAQLDMERLKNEALSRHSKLAPKDKLILERARQIEKDAKELQARCSLVVNKNQSKPNQGGDHDKQDIKNRRKKFKPLGGSKGWIPL